MTSPGFFITRETGRKEAEVAASPSSSSMWPAVGTTRRVVRRAGEEPLDAQIHETKTVDGEEAPQFYVHYTNHDRRLDEWVRLDQFMPIGSEDAAASSSAACGEAEAAVVAVRSRRSHKRRGDSVHGGSRRHGGHHHSHHHLHGGHYSVETGGDPTLAERLEAAREEITRVKNVPSIVFSGWEVESWYWSPFPAAHHGKKLYMCDFTLRYTASKGAMLRHAARYRAERRPRHPPGERIYLDDDKGLSLWEVDGNKATLYCQSLCLVSKLFLDHKTLYYDVDPFLFYVLTERRPGVDGVDGHHLLGYFSKEKASPDEYNLACILTFPQYQRNGYGTLLISLSYELSKVDRRQGAPEKPLSDLGKISYRAYWTWTLLNVLRAEKTDDDGVPAPKLDNIDEIARRCGLKFEDAISTLAHLKMLRHWKGQFVVYAQRDAVDDLISLVERPPRLCDPACVLRKRDAPDDDDDDDDNTIPAAATADDTTAPPAGRPYKAPKKIEAANNKPAAPSSTKQHPPPGSNGKQGDRDMHQAAKNPPAKSDDAALPPATTEPDPRASAAPGKQPA